MEHRATAVTSRALELALRGEQFQVSDLQRALTDAPSRQTCYRVLRQLEADDWIYCEGHTWKPDIKARMLADVDERERGRGFSFDAEELLGE